MLDKFFSIHIDGKSNTYDTYNAKYFWNCFYINNLINKRNQNWENKILKILPNQPVFIVVGVLHLFTEKGLLKYLISNGYKVEPL